MPEEPIRHADGIDTFVLVRPDPIPAAPLFLPQSCRPRGCPPGSSCRKTIDR